jgi:hypothetical protein
MDCDADHASFVLRTNAASSGVGSVAASASSWLAVVVANW